MISRKHLVFAPATAASFSILAAAAMAADLTVKTPEPPPPFFVFQDTVLEYRLETAATEPGAAVHFPKQIANVTHVDAYQYGTNFVSVDFLKSTNADPSFPATFGPRAATAWGRVAGVGGAARRASRVRRARREDMGRPLKKGSHLGGMR